MNIVIGSTGFLGSYLSNNIDNVLSINSQEYNNFIKNFYYENYYIYVCADVINNKKIINDLIQINKNNKYVLFSSAAIYYSIKKETYFEIDSNYDKTNDNYVNLIKENEELFLKLNGIKKIIRLGTLYGFAPNLDASRGIHRMIYYPLINNYIEII